MFSISNGLSFLRAPLALLFIFENTWTRLTAVILAMLSDCIDGYLARKGHCTTQFGAILDPAMDKLFVGIALIALLYESKILPWQALCLLARDFSVALFGIYLKLTGRWKKYKFHSILWGKITTACQFVVLIALTLGLTIYPPLYFLFILFGIFFFAELMFSLHRKNKKPS